MSLTVRQGDVSSSIVPKSIPNAITKTPGRCSGLKAPIMHLSGHTGEVMSAKFSPDGESIASASSDHQICKLLIPIFMSISLMEYL
jgi:Prp8 binding protein